METRSVRIQKRSRSLISEKGTCLAEINYCKAFNIHDNKVKGKKKGKQLSTKTDQ